MKPSSVDADKASVDTKWQALKFAIVGGSATLVHSGIYLAITELTSLSPQIGNLLGFALAVFVSYTGQRRWTFGSVNVESERSAKLKFMFSSLLSLALNAFWVWLVVDALKLDSSLALIGIVFATPVFIFLTLKLWVFKDVS